jgi:MinD superfamily P-loop ATPase
LVTIDIHPIKQLVFLSGKGGTGKTSICAGLIHLAAESPVECVFVDADVDAANLALVTGSTIVDTHPFSGSLLAVIDQKTCVSCGKCYEVCRFDAIRPPADPGEEYHINELNCEGCSACVHVCPESAIQMIMQQDGEWYHSTTPYGHQFHAELFPAAENTGKLVTIVKQNAKLFAEDHHLPLMIIDGPPGIGCPAISASAGADLALLVAEPGLSGIHDLERIMLTLEHFNIPAQVCINKANLHPEGTQLIHTLAQTKGYPVVGEIPFDDVIPQSMVQAQPITQFAPQSPSSIAIHKIWQQIQQMLFPQGAQG